MSTPKILIVSAFSVIFVGAILQPAQDEQAAPKQQIGDAEIKKLVSQLGDDNFQIREKASKRLEEIGKAALDCLYDAEDNKDPELRSRAISLVKAIRARHGLPTRVNGLEFELVMKDKVWIAPKVGGKTSFAIALRMTNTTKTAFRLALDDETRIAAHVILEDAKGKGLGGYAGSDHPSLGQQISPPLDKNQIHTIWFHGGLIWREGQLEVWFDDPNSRCFVFRNLSKGEYRLSVVYWNDKVASDGGVPLWEGNAVTLGQTVTIK